MGCVEGIMGEERTGLGDGEGINEEGLGGVTGGDGMGCVVSRVGGETTVEDDVAATGREGLGGAGLGGAKVGPTD